MRLSVPPKPVAAAQGAEDVDYPAHFLCPITLDVMHDPVRDPNGHVYERQALLRALARNPTSPLTRAPLRPHQLKPADDVRAAIAAVPSARAAAARAAAERQKQWAGRPARTPAPELTPTEVRPTGDWLEPARLRLALQATPLATSFASGRPRAAAPMRLAPPPAWPAPRYAAPLSVSAPARPAMRQAAYAPSSVSARPYQFIDPPTRRWPSPTAPQHHAPLRGLVAGSAPAPAWRGCWQGARVQWKGVF